jgi:single-strand DNA-binding protein
MFQEVIIVGNLGTDVEMRYMPDGTAVSNFSVAVNRKWKDQATGEQVEEVCWFRVSVWGAQAEACTEYLEKGRQVLVTGRLQPDPKTGGPKIWSRQVDGTAGASYDLRAFNVRFLGGRDDDAGGPQGQSTARQAAVEEDEIPF